MRLRRAIARGGVAVALLLAAGGAAWLAALPAGRPPAPQPAVSAEEHAATIAALQPPKRRRPLIAIVGINDATETTDYLMPYGVLRRADVADVVLLATRPGAVQLYPALKVQPDMTLGDFDARHPDGADFVVVPAMSRDDDPAVLRWIRAQAGGGAVVVGVCAGAKVVAETGLLDGRRATSHWWFLKRLLRDHPAVRHQPDRRFVVDRGVATTTGITASMPMSLTLVEAIAGRGKAEAVAKDLGLPAWDARHDSGAFAFTRPFATTVLGNTAAFWRRERLGLPLQPGVDEVSLALTADAWSRTYRSRTRTLAPDPGPVVTRSGARILPDETSAAFADRTLPPVGGAPPAAVLDRALREIAARYGPATADVVAMQLEHPMRVAR